MSADLDNRFNYHRPDAARAEAHQQVREALRSVAEIIEALTPAGREQALTYTKLEEAMFWANAAIARQGEQA